MSMKQEHFKGSGARAANPRPKLLGSALAFFACLTFVALLQPDGDPAIQHHGWSDPMKWLLPIHWNAGSARVAVEGTINGLTSAPGTRHVWAAGNGGLVLHSEDGGWTWTQQNPPASVPSTARAPFRAPRTVHADAGPQSKQPDNAGGSSPNYGSSPPVEQKAQYGEGPDPKKGGAIARPPVRNVPAVNKQPEPQRPAVPGDPTDDLIGIAFDNERTGRAYGRYGTVLATADGGRTWTLDPARGGQPERTRRYASIVANETGIHPRADSAAAGASALCGLNGSDSQAAAAFTEATAVWCRGNTVWTAGSNGILRRLTGQGSPAVQEVRTPTGARLNAVYFEPDLRRGWAAGENGVVLHTDDGGSTWIPQTRVPESAGSMCTRIPAVWYYLVTFPTVFLLIWRASRPLPPAERHESVEGVMASDAPLDENAPDVMDFRRLAQCISRFLRHERTVPPLTIAVDGQWGSGKSSLMNLLRADLERYGFRPVWFNAWHHQGEEHLLAALLESIQSQATPPWWRPDNWIFRFRLLRIRGERHWLPVVLLLSLLSGLAMAVATRGGDYDAVAGLAARIRELDLAAALAYLPNSTPSLAFFAAALSTAAAFWKGLTAFGVSPAKMLASVSASARMRDLQLQTGFRQRFAGEFHDVTEALGPRSLIIFIDDIDRCAAQNVLTVLESINFLVSSGPCYIVIGMARDMVERAVGLQFAPVVEELADDGLTDPTAEQRRERRLRFARQYLDKLINIEIPLAEPTDEQARRLLLERQTDAPEPSLAQRAWEAAGNFAPAGLALASVLAGVWLGSRVVARPEGGATTVAQVERSRSAAGNSPAPAAPSQAAAEDLRNIPPSPPPRLTPPAGRIEGARWLIVAGIGVIVSFGIWKLREPAGLIVYDSREFKDAVDSWRNVVRMRQNTPRSLKRFMNRVRYIAMQQMPPEPADSWFSEMLRRAGLAPEAHQGREDSGGMRECILVALSALHYVDPALPGQASALKASDENDLGRAIAEHVRNGFPWPPSVEEVAEFHSILPTVRVPDAKAANAG